MIGVTNVETDSKSLSVRVEYDPKQTTAERVAYTLSKEQPRYAATVIADKKGA